MNGGYSDIRDLTHLFISSNYTGIWLALGTPYKFAQSLTLVPLG